MIMKWSYDYDMHIAVVIHQTNEGKARGHIGTEIENKSETVIKVERDGIDVNVSKVIEVFGRGKGFEEFEFFVDDNGLPVIGSVDFTKEFGNNDDAPF